MPGSSTPILIDINPGAASSIRLTPFDRLYQFTEFNGDLYFIATPSASVGPELFKIAPGSAAPTLIDLTAGTPGSSPFNLAKFNGALYFSAVEFGIGLGRELYKLTAGAARRP